MDNTLPETPASEDASAVVADDQTVPAEENTQAEEVALNTEEAQ